MVTKASSGDGDDLSDSGLEYGKRFLPPLWVDLQEEIEAHISEISSKSTILFTLTDVSGGAEEASTKAAQSYIHRRRCGRQLDAGNAKAD